MDRIVGSGHRKVQHRDKIIWLWLRGISARSISHQTGASLTTVYRWIHRWQESRKLLKPYNSIFKYNFPLWQKTGCVMSKADQRSTSSCLVPRIMSRQSDGSGAVQLTESVSRMSLPNLWNVQLSHQNDVQLKLASLYQTQFLFCKACTAADMWFENPV